ncbi:MAG TPA: IclR family transcriptional regulator [Terriglobales bacterium]|nr:IclR family transcriptional regulator [Terriglobales bacterium]
MSGTAKRTYNITSLQRALRLLQLFASTERGLAAAQVARLSGLPVSTIHRFLVNLETAGYLNCNESGIYHLGIACFSLGQAALGQLDIRRLSLPHLQELNQHTRETIHLTVRNGLSAVYVEKLDSLEPLRIHSRIGASVPLYCTAVGKVMLAYLSLEEQLKMLPQFEMRRLTPHTVGSQQELQTQLQKVRKQGYAYDLEEHELHIRCIAAPIWDHTAAVNASLSVTAPVVRMSMTRLRQLAPLIQEAGLKISRELGYRVPSGIANQGVPSRKSLERPQANGDNRATVTVKSTLNNVSMQASAGPFSKH